MEEDKGAAGKSLERNNEKNDEALGFARLWGFLIIIFSFFF
jgi:hypothetical protein